MTTIMKLSRVDLLWRNFRNLSRRYKSSHGTSTRRTLPDILEIDGKTYKTDPNFTNVTPKIVSHVNRQLFLNKDHPGN